MKQRSNPRRDAEPRGSLISSSRPSASSSYSDSSRNEIVDAMSTIIPCAWARSPPAAVAFLLFRPREVLSPTTTPSEVEIEVGRVPLVRRHGDGDPVRGVVDGVHVHAEDELSR
jgi:hypothetical protein